MKIQIWSDFVCPFCYIGERRLQNAIETLPYKERIEVDFRSFELDPNHPGYSGSSIHEVLSQKYGMSLDQAKGQNDQIGLLAKDLGLDYDADAMKYTNTLNAHRLLKFAKEKGKEKEVLENLFSAYFAEGKDLGDTDTLIEIMENSGFDKEESRKVIDDSSAYLDQVRMDEAMARQYSINSVPFFLIDNKYSISGAQPAETFVQALNKAWQEQEEKTNTEDLSTDKGSTCEDGNCSL